MGNASKALLIAAAVLIVIIIVAFSMKVLSSPKDSIEQAQGVGSSISAATQGATGKLFDQFGSGITFAEGEELTTEQLLDRLSMKKEDYTGTYDKGWKVIGREGKKYKLVSTENVTTETLGYNDPTVTGSNNLEKAISSYNNAVNRLDSAVQGAIGQIAKKGKARSITVEDIEKVLGIDPTTQDNYGKKYKYYFENSKIYSQYEENNGEWVDNVGGSENYFFRSNDNTIINPSNTNKEVIITNNFYGHNFTSEEKSKYSYLTNGTYWLASLCVSCYSDEAGFIVRSVHNSSYIAGISFFYSSDYANERSW